VAPSSTCSMSAGAPTTSRGGMNVTSDAARGETGLRLIGKDSFQADPNPTPGMTREHAITADGLTSGTVTTAPGVMSGWHHHGTRVRSRVGTPERAARHENGQSESGREATHEDVQGRVR